MYCHSMYSDTPRLLVSVTNEHEALLAAQSGADLIDLKDPHNGALGRLPYQQIECIVRCVNGQRPVSATVGDWPEPETIKRVAACGVDFVKTGFLQCDMNSVETLGRLTESGIRLVAVLFADQPLQPLDQFIHHLAAAGFHGVMLDTASKSGGSLRQHLPVQSLQYFLRLAHKHQLFSGLAGSLRLDDIQPLCQLKPQPAYLGLRGGLCQGTQRTAPLDKQLIELACQLMQPLETYTGQT